MPTRAHLHQIYGRIVSIRLLHVGGARHSRAGDGVVHAVDAAQKGGLAAARGTDERHDAVIADIDIHVENGLLLSIEHRHVARRHHHVVG